jgi:hypothetical protein
MSDGRIIVHFSCGAASAVAWKIAKERYGLERQVEAIYCAGVERDEHPDNARFLGDVERWVGGSVVKLRHAKYDGIDEVFFGESFMRGPAGAVCTRVLKREVGDRYCRSEDFHVLGFTADEPHRIASFTLNNPDKKTLWLLAKGGITKEDCYHVLSANGIELPAMYRLGYEHNNCIGCVKGGKGYWNKIRRDFPDVFEKRAKQQREIGCAFSSGGELFWLDELDPDAGRDVPEPPIECGIFCSRYATLIETAKGAA